MNTVIKHTYLAVTSELNWVCKHCGSDLAPLYLTTFPAVASRSAESRKFGSHVVPPVYLGDPHLSDVTSNEPISVQILCSDCDEAYEPTAVDGSIAGDLQEEGVEKLEVEMAYGLNIPCFFPGSDAQLYGPHCKEEEKKEKLKGFIAAKKGIHNKNDPISLVHQESHLVWKFTEGGMILPADRFSEEFQQSMTLPIRVSLGMEDIPNYPDAHRTYIEDERVIWVREDLIRDAGMWDSIFVRSLVDFFNTVVWWRQDTMDVLEIGSAVPQPQFKYDAAKF